MKKLLLLVVAFSLVFCACNNKKEEKKNQVQAPKSTEQKCDKGACCNENCKEMMEQWQKFAELTADEQGKLIEKRYNCITNKLNALNMDEIDCPNAKAGIEDFKARFAAAADNDAKKVLIDEFDSAHWKHAVVGEGGCNHEENGACESKCDNKCGKDCKTECCKDNCKGGDCKHDCQK